MDPRLNNATSASKLPAWPIMQTQLKTQLQQLQQLLRTPSTHSSDNLQKLQGLLRPTPQPAIVRNTVPCIENPGRQSLCPSKNPHFAMEPSKTAQGLVKPATVPLSIANSCPYLVDFNRSAPQPTPPSGSIDLNQALN